MKIYTISIFLLFFSITQSNAQSTHLFKSKTTSATKGLKTNNTLNLYLTALIEGLYDTDYGEMTVTPSVTVELHDGSSLALVESQTATLSMSGDGTFTFSKATNGTPYYIVVKSPNTIETWSATTQSFTLDSLSYDFTTDLAKAYTDGSGFEAMIKKGSKWCIYSGDVNQDGGIDISDKSEVSNDALGSGLPGHYSGDPTDLDGDGGVDISDKSIVSNNAVRGAYSSIPLSGTPPNSLFYEGQTYHIVQIGTQYWLKENLNVGTWIDGSQNQTDPNNIQKYCPDNNPDNCNTYGGLYQWNQAMQFVTTAGTQGICPQGWHIPTLNDFDTLAATVSNDGNTLKEIGQDTYGTNTSGFSGLYSGFDLIGDGFNYFGEFGVSGSFWSSTQSDEYFTYIMSLYYNDSGINLGSEVSFPKINGYSVRCVKN